MSVLTSESPSYVPLPEALPALPASVDDSESRPGSPPYDLSSFRCKLDGIEWTASSKVDVPDSAAPARAPQSMQTGQNSIAPENSFPQLGQVRRGSALMFLNALQRKLPRKMTTLPPGLAQKQPARLLICCPSLARVDACSVILTRQIALRNKIPAAGSEWCFRFGNELSVNRAVGN
jgi:hypothetical protein